MAAANLFRNVGDDIKRTAPQVDSRQVTVETVFRPGFAGRIGRAQRHPAKLRQGSVDSVVFDAADDDAVGGQSDGAVRAVPDECNVMPLAVVDGQVDAER